MCVIAGANSMPVLNLSDKAIRYLAAPAKQIDFYDSGRGSVTGLILKASPGGARTFYLLDIQLWACQLLATRHESSNRHCRKDVARQLKAAGEKGIKICTATVPHRADNVVRSNPELRGRLAQVDTTFWSPQELSEIAKAGFAKLQVSISLAKLMDIAREACGSPQLMQRICLDVCFNLGIEKEFGNVKHFDFTPQQLSLILQQSSTHSDFGTMVANMHQGPKERGSERRVHQLIDGTTGDVYRVILLALAYDPPVMEVPYSSLMARIENVCKGDGPSASSIVQACRQIAKIALRIAPKERVLEWDDQELTGTMSVVDPYFLFYLRRSRKLDALANKQVT